MTKSNIFNRLIGLMDLDDIDFFQSSSFKGGVSNNSRNRGSIKSLYPDKTNKKKEKNINQIPNKTSKNECKMTNIIGSRKWYNKMKGQWKRNE